MTLTVGQSISFSYAGSTAYAGESFNGNAVATGNLVINDGNGQGTYSNVTMYYDPNATGLLGAVTGVYYISAGGYTFVNAINSYLQYDGSFTVSTVISNTGQTSNTETETITFTATPQQYNVVFQESGLVTGATWSVTFNGTTQSSTTTSITFSNVSSGTYSFTVSANGYKANPASGSVTVP